MRLKDVITMVKTNTLPNVTERIILSNKDAISLINEGILSLHSRFTINVEQALILVPKYRNIFKIDTTDPNVIMNTIGKISKGTTSTDIFDNTLDKYTKLENLTLDKNVKRFLTEGKSNHNINIENLKKEFSSPDKRIPLQFLEVEDNEGNEYNFNTNGVFITDSNTLYFPECKEGMQIYVKYKAKPLTLNEENLDNEIDLPNMLLECLYAFISLKVITGIDGMNQFYPNVLNTYNQCIEKAVMYGYAVPTGLNMTLHKKKGFY